MKNTYVFRGPHYRVQLVIYDFTTDDTPPAVKEDRPKFCVRVLPNTANIYTAFALGSQPYYGDCPDTAWDTMHRYIGGHKGGLFHQVPIGLRRYLVHWSKSNILNRGE